MAKKTKVDLSFNFGANAPKRSRSKGGSPKGKKKTGGGKRSDTWRAYFGGK